MKEKLWTEAKECLAGGVNSPVRAFKSAGITPEFVNKSDGKFLYTEDEKVLLDFCLSWGAIILGHNHTTIREAVIEAVNHGMTYGLPTAGETKLAKAIQKSMPHVEKLRFVNSGTEAVMSAVRLARGFTKRDKILKFDGCYHGHSDSLLVKAGSGVAEVKASSSAGVPQGIIENTISVPFNNQEAVRTAFKAHPGEIACIIVEPVPCNMGVVPPKEDFLPFLRKIADAHGALLIFDEVITGFRIAPGGARSFFGVTADLTVLGKIIGGGLPVGAFGGRRDIMDQLAPDGDVYQAGTLSGNPLTMAAGFAAVNWLLNNSGIYEDMREKTAFLAEEFKKVSNLTLNTVSTVFTIFYTKNKVTNYSEAGLQEANLFRKLYPRVLEQGIFLPPSMFEAGFLSASHTFEDIEKLVALFK